MDILQDAWIRHNILLHNTESKHCSIEYRKLGDVPHSFRSLDSVQVSVAVCVEFACGPCPEFSRFLSYFRYVG